MARPLKLDIDSGMQNWDGKIDDNFEVLFDGPIPFHASASLTEANLQSTFPAASYERCVVWVNHSVFSYLLYFSDGTNWRPYGTDTRITTAHTGAATLNGREQVVLLSGSPPYTITLAPAANWRGRTLVLKLLVAGGTVTIDGSGAETIDGALTSTVLNAQYARLVLYSDGTAVHIIG